MRREPGGAGRGKARTRASVNFFTMSQEVLRGRSSRRTPVGGLLGGEGDVLRRVGLEAVLAQDGL